jgi:hypothetical protein
MKNLILTPVIFAATIFTTMGQTNSTLKLEEICSGEFVESEYNSIQHSDSSEELKLTYGLEINHFTSNSGFKPGVEFSLFVKGSNGRRSLEVAGFFDTESKSLEGFSINHKYMLFKNVEGRRSKFEPYAFYNFIYRSTTINGPLTTKSEIASVLGNTGKTTVCSIEHHFGLGVKMNLNNFMYFHGDFGYGCYLGSIKKPGKPDEKTGIYSGGNGWGLFSKLGIGFEF